MQSRIENFSDHHNLLLKSQLGYRKFTFAEYAFCTKIHYSRQYRNKLLTIGIFLEFSKTFDCINHDIPLDKLFSYVFWGFFFSLLNSYFENPCQYDSINEHRPSFLNITCGVAQGNILGLLLFIPYIRNIINN